MKRITYIDRKTQELVEEKPPGEAFLRFLYHHPLGKLPLESVAKRKMLTSFYGRLMNRHTSARWIRPFVKAYGIDMEEAAQELSAYRTFNEFFYRKLKPGARPIGEGLVSPGDGKLAAFARIREVGDFFIKGESFRLRDFLQDDALTERYESGAMYILRLAPPDYHRFHFPYSGIAAAPKKIRGKYYSVSPYAVQGNFARVFCQNKRDIVRLQTPDKGMVLVCPVGATMVGSILHTYQGDSTVTKGDEMGYFAFGGSTIVLLIEEGQVSIDADLLENTRRGLETAVRMGERIGE
ncbi:MAG: phosphatidylserine decarboxylase [Bacteroidetes bacterium]|nr:MAG: phosphatidylserine decarboxylase [Bacteroidota bacterium]